ncbi:GNAT family N-acetyltransferase [Paenibacillus anaericanus]|uniref:GNAT family N-acetyltransferase n=1 Tax=Paenibacillus anaericanus TaxID=170367 RepID=A0A3S1DRI9_9BACL|nr:bifunctional helix-turn-helix transcriptional regulator/GNAT family N-acetyltransferase [Paenibacillus anaericanus]RUT43833.1 GNAT family N-acetyltransferase [Paenibacillus anaericanus]
MSLITLENRIHTVRHFNRFITRNIGVLQEGLLHSPYSLTEVRIMFELAHRDNPTASDLTKELGLDAGYLSRILARLEQQGLIVKVRSETDGRQRILQLTPEGKEVYLPLNERSNEEVAEMLSELSEGDQVQLFKAMQTIEKLLTKDFKYSKPFILRPHEPGDMGWIVHKHGVLYAQEYGWDERFEASVLQIATEFINNYNPKQERCWIAEMNGEIVGSIVVVQESDTIAKLRLLIVDPKARGMGLGTRLVEEAIQFAKRAKYQKLVLWTNHVLKEARHIYRKAGFTLVAEEKHSNYGPEVIGETWELIL